MSVIPKHEPTKHKTGTHPQQAKQPDKPRARIGGAPDYGEFYWCVKTALSEDGEIYVFADEVRHLPTGGILFMARRDDGGERTNLALASGQWTAVFAASCLEGHAVALEHWKGEIIR